jgi:ABC-type phosphate transport system substrate-binding protein
MAKSSARRLNAGFMAPEPDFMRPFSWLSGTAATIASLPGRLTMKINGSAAAAFVAAASPWLACALGTVDSALPAYEAKGRLSASLSSEGDDAMAPLMDAWRRDFHARRPAIRIGRWEHRGDATAFGTLMFETADMAPLAREPLAEEIAPYKHQFAGDMMGAPLLLQVASREGKPAYIAVNKRPGAPLPPQVVDFLAFVLSREGQAVVARDASFMPIDVATAAAQREKLEGFLATLDPGLEPYRASSKVSGTVASVGSDGMKTLMDHWMRGFHAVQPGVGPGRRWEHLGTLNGFYALVNGETDIAPMGRELWADERAAYAKLHGGRVPVEIRVARGGFDTPQRTTAQAIFVSDGNPVERITLPQLAAVLGANPTITRWGQLGATGEWADRPIHVYMPPRVAPNATSMQVMVLRGGAWNAAAREGSIADTAAAIARDPDAIGFGGFEEGPGLRTLAVSPGDGAPFYEGTHENASSGRYPLTRYMYIRLDRAPGQLLAPAVKEFLRYILSRDGQEPILYSAYYPLNAQEVAEELKKLE